MYKLLLTFGCSQVPGFLRKKSFEIIKYGVQQLAVPFFKKKSKFSIDFPLLFKSLFLVPASSCQNLEVFSITCQEKQVWSVLPLIPALGISGSLCSTFNRN